MKKTKPQIKNLIKNYLKGNITIESILIELDRKENKIVFDKIMDAHFT